ncbi:hypothetical protein [Planococcus sp. YIM B11945]|uniref:hypothetical protein n=1 Tax=Planococcus sp. YIM B11945 TaxID=3435410 RepID=UPI003D7E353A
MKVLFISSQIFKKSSSASIRNNSLLNGFIKNNVEVDVLTLEYPSAFEDEYFQENIENKIKVYQSKPKILYKYLEKSSLPVERNLKLNKREKTLNKLKIKIKDLYFFPDMDKEWIKNYNKKVLKNNYDFVISSSDTKTAHFIARNILKEFNNETKWIQIWGDPWANDINLNNSQKKKAMYWESLFIKEAAQIYYVSKPTFEMMTNSYPKYSSKMHYMPRTYLTEVQNNNLKKNASTLNLLYTGSLNSNRNTLNLLNAIKTENEKLNKYIKLNIFGVCSPEIKAEFKEYKFITYHGIASYKKIITEYSRADILLFIDNGNKTTQIPGKLFDYFGTNIPILAVVEDLESPVTKFIASTQRSLILKNTPTDLRIDTIFNLSEQPILKEYSGETCAKKLIMNMQSL